MAWHGLHTRFGGAEMAALRTAALLREAGHDVFLVTLRPDAPAPACEMRYYPLPRWEDFLPPWARRYMEPVKWYVWQRDRRASRAFARVLRVENPDVVHFHNFQFMGLDLIRVAQESGARTCYSVYDYWIFCPNVMLLNHRDEYCRRFHGPYCAACLPPVFRPLQRLLLTRRRAVFDRYLGTIDAWIVLSRHSASVLKDYGISEDRIHVVRLTLPTNFRTASVAEGEVQPYTIFFAGWLQKRKGVHVLLEALPAVLQRFPEARLWVAGAHTKFDHDYKRRIAELSSPPAVRGRVEFLGHLSPSEVEARLRACAVVAIPEQYENMSPLLMIEAMTLGKPVVVSRAGGIPEFVEDGVTGWLADPRRPEDFAEKIGRVLADPETARTVGRRARERVLALCDADRVFRATLRAYGA